MNNQIQEFLKSVRSVVNNVNVLQNNNRFGIDGCEGRTSQRVGNHNNGNNIIPNIMSNDIFAEHMNMIKLYSKQMKELKEMMKKYKDDDDMIENLRNYVKILISRPSPIEYSQIIKTSVSLYHFHFLMSGDISLI